MISDTQSKFFLNPSFKAILLDESLKEVTGLQDIHYILQEKGISLYT